MVLNPANHLLVDIGKMSNKEICWEKKVCMKKSRILVQGMGIFFGTLAILWLFMVLSASIPNSLIKENMTKSAVIMTQTEAFAYHEGTKMNGISDNYADSIWLNVAWYLGNDNPFISSVNTGYYDGETEGESDGLYRAVTVENQEANTDYTRYWHGTAGIIRIFHLFTDVNGIRNAGFLVTLGLAAMIMILLIREKKDSVAIFFFVSLCMVKVWNIRFCMEYQPSFIVALLMCILYLLYEKKGDDYLILMSVASGVIIAFFDFLTTETMVILLPIILVITVRGIEHRTGGFIESFRTVMLQGIVWLTAYGMTVLAKWCLAFIIVGEDAFSLALNLAGERIGGNNPGTDKLSPLMQWLAAPAANFSMLFGGSKRLDSTLIIVGVAFVLLFFIISFLCLKFGKKENKATTLILMLLGSIILVRYLVLNNHSYVHAFFTYRGLISMIMALFSIAIINWNLKKQK